MHLSAKSRLIYRIGYQVQCNTYFSKNLLFIIGSLTKLCPLSPSGENLCFINTTAELTAQPKDTAPALSHTNDSTPKHKNTTMDRLRLGYTLTHSEKNR